MAKSSNTIARASTNAVVDPRGQRTTIRLTFATNLPSAVIDPLGNRTTYSWNMTTQTLQSVQAPTGGQVSLLYSTIAGDKTTRISSLVLPWGTFLYVLDASGRVAGMVDPASARTSLAWDANNNRTGVLDALQNRITFAYNGSGQLSQPLDHGVRQRRPGRRLYRCPESAQQHGL